jgi:hypothetical protein
MTATLPTITTAELARAYPHTPAAAGQYVTVTQWTDEYGEATDTATGVGATPEAAQAVTDASRATGDFQGGEDCTYLVVDEQDADG